MIAGFLRNIARMLFAAAAVTATIAIWHHGLWWVPIGYLAGALTLVDMARDVEVERE